MFVTFPEWRLISAGLTWESRSRETQPRQSDPSSARLQPSASSHLNKTSFSLSVESCSYRSQVLVSVSLSALPFFCQDISLILNCEMFLCEGFLALLSCWYFLIVLSSSLDNDDGETLLRFLLRTSQIMIDDIILCFYLLPAQNSCQNRITRLQGPIGRNAWFMNENILQNCKLAFVIF